MQSMANLLRAVGTTLLLFLAMPVVGADVDLLTDDTPWRVFLVTAPPMEGTTEECEPQRGKADVPPSPFPPADWRAREFDDAVWARYTADLAELLGGYGYWQSPWAALVCLRTRFGVSDPAKVEGLKLSLAYRGGAVVYVNGREIGRGHLPAGRIEPLTLADDYPPEAYYAPDGKKTLRRTARPAKDHLERYEKRIRQLELTIPPDVLREGANVLAVELHRTALLRRDWSSVGFCGATLTAETEAGVIPYGPAADRLFVWNASPLETISPTAGTRPPYRTTWNVGALAVSPAGLKYGNPFDPLRPIRMVGPRNGVCSGQIVVSAAAGLENVSAEVGRLTHAGGATLPTDAVRIRYAIQREGARYCDALEPEPTAGATVQPVWVLVDIPRDQAPGWYTGELRVRANGQQFTVPVQVLVSGWTQPDPKDYISHAGVLQSPDTVALHYGVEPFSDEHFALLDKSLALLGRLGNDVVYIPVIHHNHMGHRTGMARWVKTDSGYKVDLSAAGRYLDLYAKHCGPPRVICVVVWKPTFGNQALFRGKEIEKPDPILVTRLDPETGAMSELEAPAFGEQGSEAFWKPMVDGLRAIVKQRGWNERSLMFGQAFDRRPLPEAQAFFNRIAPGVRWVVFSHWQGDPGPKDGKLVVSGGIEVGYREEMGGGLLPALHPDRPELAEREYRTAGSHRIQVLTWSSPPSYRNIPHSGTFCRIGIDFWPVVLDGERRRDIFNTKICGAWVYKSNPVAIVAPGPEGAVPTVRFRMLREGVQETEARIALVQALARLDGEKAAACRELLAERDKAHEVAECLTQAQISLDWLGLTARMFDAAADAAGEPSQGAWNAPPGTEPVAPGLTE